MITTRFVFLSFLACFASGYWRKSSKYDEKLSVRFFDLADAAYRRNLSAYFQNHPSLRSVKLVKQIFKKCDWYRDVCSSYTAVDHVRKSIILSFEGTYAKAQVYVRKILYVYFEKNFRLLLKY